MESITAMELRKFPFELVLLGVGVATRELLGLFPEMGVVIAMELREPAGLLPRPMLRSNTDCEGRDTDIIGTTRWHVKRNAQEVHTV